MNKIYFRITELEKLTKFRKQTISQAINTIKRRDLNFYNDNIMKELAIIKAKAGSTREKYIHKYSHLLVLDMLSRTRFIYRDKLKKKVLKILEDKNPL